MMSEGLQKVSGQIVSIDHQKRTVLIRHYDEKKFEVDTPLKWPAGLDGKMGKLKEKFFQTFVFQGEIIDDCQYFAKPADWPQQQGNKGNWQGGKPRNEKPMIFESVFKSCCDQAIPFDLQNQTYEQKVDRIWAVAKKISLEIVQLSGA